MAYDKSVVMEIPIELLAQNQNQSSLTDFHGFTTSLREIVWKKYHELKDSGDYFKIKVFGIITIDISGEIAKLLTRWFGIDPYANEGIGVK